MALTFVTIGIDLVEYAIIFADRLRNNGLIVKAEVDDGAFPVTPTLVGTRGTTQHFVEVVSKIKNLNGAQRWVSFCKCRQHETYYSILIPEAGTIKGDLIAKAGVLGVGIYCIESGNIVELSASRDLCMSLELPPLAGEKRALKRALAPIYGKFENGNWFDGFRDACQLFEDHARRNLVSLIEHHAVTFSKGGVSKTYSVHQISRQTLGQLAITYSEIVLAKPRELATGRVLSHINKDRVGAVHKTNDRRVKNRLRRNVGKHMWTLVRGLRELIG